jgi:hypothetical protein
MKKELDARQGKLRRIGKGMNCNKKPNMKNGCLLEPVPRGSLLSPKNNFFFLEITRIFVVEADPDPDLNSSSY